MQIDVFKITEVTWLNQPTAMTAYAMAVLGVLFIISVFVLSTPKWLGNRTLAAKLTFFIPMMMLGGGVSYMMIMYDKEVNAHTYSSSRMCRYILVSPTETIRHETLVPIVYQHTLCSKVGKEITRIKTDKYIKFYEDFEYPS